MINRDPKPILNTSGLLYALGMLVAAILCIFAWYVIFKHFSTFGKWIVAVVIIIQIIVTISKCINKEWLTQWINRIRNR